MTASLLGPTTRILWYDPDVNNEKNVEYFKTFFSQTEIERRTSYEKAAEFLSTAPGFWIVITSGTNSENFVKQIHKLEKILGIVIFGRTNQSPLTRILSLFRRTEEYLWAQNYPKVKKVTTEIAQVVSEVEMLRKTYLLQGVLQVPGEERKHNELNTIAGVLAKNSLLGDDPPYDPQDLVFHHNKKEDQIKFLFVAKLLLEDQYHDYPEYILTELKRLNPAKGTQIEELFQPRAKEDLLQAILYMYSTNHIYGPFNKMFASQAYNQLAFTLSACLHQIMQRPELKVDPKKKLYRGLRRRAHQENYIVNDETLYWPAFTSTSLNIIEAERFAGEDGLVFEISLSQNNPHPNVVLKENWAAIPREEEVLLFSHFPMKVKSKEPYGSRILIKVGQDESDEFLSLNRSELSKHWGEFICKSVKSNYEASVELIRSKILQDFKSSNAVVVLAKRYDLDEVLEDQRFTDRLRLFKLYIQEKQFHIFSDFLEFQLDEAAGECKKLRLYYLYKEISAEICKSDYGSLIKEMNELLNGFADRFIRLNQENFNKEHVPATLFTKALEEISTESEKLDEKIKAWINEVIKRKKPELIQIAEEYWEFEHRPEF